MYYGSIAYACTNRSTVKPLDTILHNDKRIALGAQRTTTVQSLYSEAWEPSLHVTENLTMNDSGISWKILILHSPIRFLRKLIIHLHGQKQFQLAIL